MLKAVLFDLDGTLADTDPLHLLAWREVLAPYGLKVDPAFYRERISGRLNPEIVRDLLGLEGEEAERLIATKEARFRELAQGLRPTPGLPEFLERIREKGLLWGVVTNAPRENARHVLEALDLEEGPALLLAYAPGEELGRWMGKNPAFFQAMRVFHQLLLALAHMHEKGLVHRDVKPENILVNAGEARLLDFDLSGPAQERFQKPLLLGTPAYLAPELLRGLPSGPEADVYAAGIILYWMLTGEHPFADPSGQVSLDPDRGPHPPVAGLGEEAALYLERLLAPDPKARFPTAQEALRAFPF